MNCKECGSARIAKVNGKCSDMCYVTIGEAKHDGYVPSDMGIGGGDSIDIDLCLNCGTVQGTFPLPLTELEIEEENKLPMLDDLYDIFSYRTFKNKPFDVTENFQFTNDENIYEFQSEIYKDNILSYDDLEAKKILSSIIKLKKCGFVKLIENNYEID